MVFRYINGFVVQKIILFHEITCVRKAKTVAIFPNAIEIIAGEKKYFFGSFLSRDEAYRLIIDGWEQYGGGTKDFQDSQVSILFPDLLIVFIMLIEVLINTSKAIFPSSFNYDKLPHLY
ncbi:hypothetical protein BHM03_00044906 [Ensete ventricosum]|uniref:GRAM domain-containing protein n=1 Tax=Ensete ventricosum TaxID=4639 RepID=A0A426XGJ2_ENSVE|nr:hypothetical protein B296_00031782 [Ensete ventricosum]RZS13337.1 hypothetical protein BHM03_00044906 [Ensete ventricosum]